MTAWIKGAGGVVNLAHVSRAEVRGNGNGVTRFYLATSADWVDIDLGSDDAEAQTAVERLVHAIDPTTFS